MIQRKVPVTVVQKLLGHASVNTTLIYAKMLDTDVKDSHTRTVVYYCKYKTNYLFCNAFNSSNNLAILLFSEESS